jgi:hypothetical protein
MDIICFYISISSIFKSVGRFPLLFVNYLKFFDPLLLVFAVY